MRILINKLPRPRRSRTCRLPLMLPIPHALRLKRCWSLCLFCRMKAELNCSTARGQNHLPRPPRPVTLAPAPVTVTPDSAPSPYFSPPYPPRPRHGGLIHRQFSAHCPVPTDIPQKTAHAEVDWTLSSERISLCRCARHSATCGVMKPPCRLCVVYN